MKSYDGFDKAREFVRNQKIPSASKWREYSSSDKKPPSVPSHPDRHYKNRGWISWMDWLGTENKQGGNRRYVVNDHYFKKWSRNMAYTLGFWFTDGYMDERFNLFSITQRKDDAYILEGILEDMESNYLLKKHGDNNLVFKITSEEIVKDIKSFGGFQCKSHNIKFPSNIPKKYMPDFIRGLWDGDGSITFQKSEKCYVSSFVSSSKCFVLGLLECLQNEISDFKGTVGFYNNVYVLSVGVNDTRRLRDYLYRNISSKILFLKRKCDKFFDSGDIRIACQNKKFISYSKAQKIVRKLGITRYKDWRKYKKLNRHKNTDIDAIPSNFENTYKNKGWIDWDTFAGTKFWSFVKAKKYVRSMNLKNALEWREYASTKRTVNIPSNPWQVYKEWVSMCDWLGIKKT